MRQIKIGKTVLFLLLFILFSFSVFAGEKQLSNSYKSLDECNIKVKEYNKQYPDFYRTSCFNGENNLYYYNICDSQLECNINSNINNEITLSDSIDISNNNPFAKNFSDSILKILTKIVSTLSSQKEKLSGIEYNNLIKAFDLKLDKIQAKYKNNKNIENLLKYLSYETEKLYINTDVDDFFCELTGNCDDSSNITSPTSIDNNSKSNESSNKTSPTSVDSNSSNDDKTKNFTNPKINGLNILQNFGGTTGITKFCIQNGYTRAAAIKTNILAFSERQTNGLYWSDGEDKFFLYYYALKTEEYNGQNSFEYAKKLDEYWNYVTNVTCINDNYVIIDDSKRIDESECESIIKYGNIKLCSTSKIAETYEEKDSICPSGFKIPNPIELSQILYSSKSHFTLNSPFLKFFPKGAYWLAGKGKSGNPYLYVNKMGGGGAKEIFGWIAVQRYLKQDKYVMCYQGPDISMNKYEMSTGFNFYLGGYPQGICNSISTVYKGYTINSTDRTYLLNGEKAIFDTNDDDMKIVMTCNSSKLETKTEDEFNEDEEKKIKEEQEKLEQQKIEEENKRLLEEEAKKLGCEKLIKFGDISLCDTGKSVAFNGLHTVSCPTGYKTPNYREAMHFKLVDKEMINAGFNSNYWTSSVYKDIAPLNSIPPKQENNRYLTSGGQDNGSLYLLLGLVGGVDKSRTLDKYNVLCYKGPSISNKYINNCNLNPFYKYGDDTFINRMDRKILLMGEKIVLESGNEKKIEIFCNGRNLNIKPLNYETSIKLELSNSKPKVGENISLSWLGIGVSDCKILDNIKDNIYEINPLYLHTIFNNYGKELNIQNNNSVEIKPYYNTNIIIQCIDDFTGEKIKKEINISGINSDNYIASFSDTANYRLEYIGDNKYKVYWSTGYQIKNNYCQFIGMGVGNIPNSGYRMIGRLKNNPIFSNYLGDYYLDYGNNIIDVTGYNPLFPLEIGLGCGKFLSTIKIPIKKLYSNIYNNSLEYDTEGYLIYKNGHLNWSLKGIWGNNIKIEDLSGEKTLNGRDVYTTRFWSGGISFFPKKSTTIKLSWDGSNGKKYEKFIYVSIYE